MSVCGENTTHLGEMPLFVRTVVEDMRDARRGGLGQNEDLLAILSSSDSRFCWVLLFRCAADSVVSKHLPRPDSQVLDNQLRGVAEEDFRWFQSWSGEMVVGRGGRALLVKVSEEELWFLRIPLTLFVQGALGAFSQYDYVSWIVTERTFSEALGNRSALSRVLASAPNLLDSAVVIINTYEHHQETPDAPLLRKGIAAIEKILSRLQDQKFPDGFHSLRWLKNPSEEATKNALTDERTKIVLGAFEAGNGKWQLGQDLNLDTRAPAQYFPLSNLHGMLGHILLMRSFHCYSIFDPYLSATVGGQPADKHTLARELLQTGIQFVEGAMTEQSYLEFLASVINFLYRGSLRFLLDNADARNSEGIDGVREICNEILSLQGYEILF
jgi:hypothetical protein